MWFGIRTHTMLDLVMKALQLLFIVCLFQQCLSSAETPLNGIFFNYHQKILLAKSFENVQKVLPYPQVDATIDLYITTIAFKMDQLWNHPDFGCDLLNHKITQPNFTTDWVYNEILQEHQRVLRDISSFKSEVTSLFPDLAPSEPPRRNPRALRVVLLAGAATGVFGLGYTLKDKISCTSGRIFGGCNKLAKENRRAIMDTIAHVNEMNSAWASVQNATNEKFYIIGQELKDL